jgi:methyl-accepting chemotaxis protein
MQRTQSVFTRILLAFGGVIVVFSAAIALSMLRLGQFNDAVRAVTTVNLPKLQTASAWTGVTLKTEVSARNLLLIDDKSKIDAEMAKVTEYHRQRKQYREQMLAGADSTAEKAVLQKVVAARDIYVPIETECLTLLAKGQIKEAREAVLERAAPALAVYLQSLGQLSDFYNAQMQAAAEDLAAAHASTRLFLQLLTVVAIAISGLLAYLLARSIRKPLDKAVRTLDAIESGNYDSRIRVRNGDETGRVLRALDRMQSSLKTRIESERAAAQENARIRMALDRVSVAAMLVEPQGTVIYANDFARALLALRSADIRASAPQFDAERIVGGDIQSLHRVPLGSSGPYSAEVAFGAVTLRIVANPVQDGAGKNLGTIVQLVDRTSEVTAEDEVKRVVASAIDGDLSARIDERSKDGFFKVLAEGMNQLTGNMAEVVRQMSLAAAEVRTGADEISRGNMNLSQRTEQQASSLEETAASMEEMTSTVRNNADNAAQANQLAAAAREQAERGGKVVGAAVSAMSEINVASKKIADIIGVIDEIAFQTNLLALNAAVEAARAGEQGRGFAVVASEVRNLASRSAEAAKEIKGLIQDSVGKVNEGSRLVDESGKVLTEIVTGVKKVTDVVAEIAASSREQASGIDQVNKAITSMDSTTQQNAALVEQASAAAQALTEQASNLSRLIEKYGAGQSAAAAPLRRPAGKTAQAPRTERRSAERPWNDRAAPGPKAGSRAPAAAPEPKPAAQQPKAAASQPKAASTAGNDQEWEDF